MDKLFETLEEKITILGKDLDSLKSTLYELKEKKKQRDEEFAVNNPFVKFLELKKEIFETHEDYTKTFYSTFIDDLKAFVNEFDGVEDDDYVECKKFISQLMTDNNGEFYTYFREFVNDDKLTSFVEELKALIEPNGCVVLDSKTLPDVKSTDEYKEFEKNLLHLIKVVSKKRYQMNADPVDFTTETERKENEDNSKQ